MQKAARLRTAASTTADASLSFPPNSAELRTLPNGLTLIVQEDRSAPVASVQAWCGTGSIHEDAQLGAGLSHMLEHMLFKGTKTRGANGIAQSVQDVGGYINAYTSFDRTVYWIDTPKDGVATALEILSDAMMNSTLPRDEYAKEQEVIRREFAMGMDDPDRMAGQLLFATAYQLHPYRVPVIGHLEVFNQLSHEQLMSYYKSRYVPNNLTFVIVGDVDAEAVHTQLAGFFESYPERPLRPIYIPPEPTQLGRREANRDFATELSRLSLAWHIPEVSHRDVPALDLLSTLLGDGRSSRLYQRVREESGLAFSVSAFSYTPGDPGLFGIEATVDPAKREAAQQLVLQMLDELKQQGATADELAKAKKTSLTHHLHALTTMRGQASDIGSSWLLTRNLNFTRTYLDAVQQVTVEDIQRAAQTYCTDMNLTVTSLDPKGTALRKATTAARPAAGEIQKHTLPNGLRVLVREDRRLPLVAITAAFRGGLLAEQRENNGITRLLARSLLKGTKTRTAEEIADAIESVGGSIGSEVGNNSFSISLDVTKPDLPLAVEILADVLLNATMPEQHVEREKEVQIAAILEEDEHLTSVARNILRSALFGEHPYALRGSGSAESVAELAPADLRAMRDRLVVAKNCVVSVFGDVDSSEVQRLFQTMLGEMPAGEMALAKASPSQPLERVTAVENFKDKAQGVLMVGYRGADIYTRDRYALELIDEASSDLGSRFFVRIREQMGLAYYVGASQMQGLVPGVFLFYLGTDPLKLEPVKTALLEEINRLAADGLSDAELARSKKKLIGQQQIANQSNDTFGHVAALDELYGLGFDHYKELEPTVNAITAEEVKRVAQKYFREQPYVIATVRPPESRSKSITK
ncbi:MAG: M16 family metallopeptidase [Chthoniobacterales bacterium]